jgi:hypothetical protein
MAGKNATENTRKHSNFKFQRLSDYGAAETGAVLRISKVGGAIVSAAARDGPRPGPRALPSGYDGLALEAALATLRSKCGIGGNGQGRRDGRQGQFRSAYSCTSNGASARADPASIQEWGPARGRGYTSIWCANAGKVLGNS